VKTVERLKEKTGYPYERVCAAVRLNHSRFKRWKKRLARGEPGIKLPGPKKVVPIEPGVLQREMENLHHCRKQSHGTLGIIRTLSYGISRRELLYHVAMARYDAYKEHERNMRRIHWLISGAVWSMDDSEFYRDIQGNKQYLHNMYALGSSYRFRSIAGDMACGESIAGNLAAQFDQYGPCLFLKRDNAGNLNHGAVNDVLKEYYVMPLNSPSYYPQYNGSMESSQTDLKAAIRDRLSPYDTCTLTELDSCAEAASHDLNHRSKRSLKGRTPCQAFLESMTRLKKYTKRKRREIYELILEHTDRIFNRMRDNTTKAFQSAYRIAVETWLRKNGFIFVTIGGKVLPHFPGIQGHY